MYSISMRKLPCLAVEGAICIAIVLLYLSTSQGRRPLELFSCTTNNGTSVRVSDIAMNKTMTPFEDILPLLQNAATDDNTVIITSVNEAWSAPDSLLDLFLQNFRVGMNIEHLLSHLIIVALDLKAFERCKTFHEHCYRIKLEGIDFADEKVFMSKDYLELVWAKLDLQQRVLEFGYNFLFTDVDVLWFRNPFKRIAVYPDMTTSCDIFVGSTETLRNSPNTGFFYVKSTKRTIKMLKYWREARNRFPLEHEQFVFNIIKPEIALKIKIKMQFLDTVYFGGFCNLGNDLNKICTMHANCCVRIDNKLNNLRNAVDAWKNYTSVPVKDKKRRRGFTWQAPIRCMPLLS